MRRVWGCTPASSAATLMMYTPRSSPRFLGLAIRVTSLGLVPKPGPGALLMGLLELLQELSLPLGQTLRYLDRHRHQQVAPAAAPLGGAVPSEPERLPAGGARGDPQRHRAVQGGHL